MATIPSSISFQILRKKARKWCKKTWHFGPIRTNGVCNYLIPPAKKKYISLKDKGIMIKFVAENFGYGTHVGTARKERLHAIGSGHGVLRSLAGEKRKVPRRGSALSTLQLEEAFLLPQAPETHARLCPHMARKSRNAKVQLFHIRRQGKQIFLFKSPLCVEGKG